MTRCWPSSPKHAGECREKIYPLEIKSRSSFLTENYKTEAHGGWLAIPSLDQPLQLAIFKLFTHILL